MRLLGSGDFENAAAEFTQAIAIVPEYADAYLGRGKARRLSGQSQAALEDFSAAIARDATLDAAYTARGTLLLERGDITEALTDFNRSIGLRPTADAYYQRGVAYQRLGQPQNAVNSYRLAIELDPAVPHFYRSRGKAELDLGQLADAKADQETAERLEKTR